MFNFSLTSLCRPCLGPERSGDTLRSAEIHCHKSDALYPSSIAADEEREAAANDTNEANGNILSALVHSGHVE